MDEQWPHMPSQGVKILPQISHFRGHLSTFGAENKPKSGPFKSENNAQTPPEQLQNNFEKSRK